jgi:hypothetical protein
LGIRLSTQTVPGVFGQAFFEKGCGQAFFEKGCDHADRGWGQGYHTQTVLGVFAQAFFEKAWNKK